MFHFTYFMGSVYCTETESEPIYIEADQAPNALQCIVILNLGTHGSLHYGETIEIAVSINCPDPQNV